jgi:hypothetical protein
MPILLFEMPFQMQRGNNAPLAITMGALIFVIVLVVVLTSIARKRKATAGAYRKGPFLRRAMAMGLGRQDAKKLEELIETYKPRNPWQLLTNSPILDTMLKRAIQDINMRSYAENIKDAEKNSIYRIKQIIERNSQVKQTVSSSKQLAINQAVAISPQEGGRYPSKVAANLRDVIALDMPVDQKGTQVRWKKGTEVKVFFWKKNGQGYTFESKITGYNAVKGVSKLLVRHSNQVKEAQQRRFRRKQIERPAYFYAIKVLPTGMEAGAPKRAVIENRKGTLGNLVDLSTGGCCLRTNFPLLKGELIKVEFDTDKKNGITAFGKVKHVRKLKPMGGLMHIQFTRLSQTSMRRINSYVYDF